MDNMGDISVFACFEVVDGPGWERNPWEGRRLIIGIWTDGLGWDMCQLSVDYGVFLVAMAVFFLRNYTNT